MAITTYEELKTAISSWTDDDDAAGFADEYIDLVESRLLLEFRVMDMEANDSITLTSGEGSLPSDFKEVRRVKSDTSPDYPLEYVTPDVLKSMYPTTTSGYPRHYTIEDDKIIVRPTASTVTLYYYQDIPSLSDSQTSNFVLSKVPGVYLHGCEAEHAWKYRKYERGSMADARMRELMELFKTADKAARWPNASARVSGVTP